LEVEIAVFEDGVEPEWLLEPPPMPAARVRSPGLAPGGTSAALLLKKKEIAVFECGFREGVVGFEVLNDFFSYPVLC